MTKPKTTTPPRRLIYIDALNIIAILSVLFLHHNGLVHIFSRERYWTTSLIAESVFYYAVPVFLMITGATLLDYRKKYDTKTYFKKRFLKILVPSIVWMLIMFFWHVVVFKDINITNYSLSDIVNYFMTNQENSIYYYLFVIIGVYLTIPLFSPLTENLKYRKILWYGVAVWLIFNTLLPDLSSLIGIYWNGDLGLRIGTYIVYLFLGYLLKTSTIPKKYRIMLYVGGILAILYRFLTTYFFSMEAGMVIEKTWGYSSFHTIILASSVFVFVKNLPLDKISDRAKRLLHTLASCSFGIYLSHVLVMHYILVVSARTIGLQETSIIWRYICPLLTYFVCVFAVIILKKIPIIKKIVP